MATETVQRNQLSPRTEELGLLDGIKLGNRLGWVVGQVVIDGTRDTDGWADGLDDGGHSMQLPKPVPSPSTTLLGLLKHFESS